MKKIILLLVIFTITGCNSLVRESKNTSTQPMLQQTGQTDKYFENCDFTAGKTTEEKVNTILGNPVSVKKVPETGRALNNYEGTDWQGKDKNKYSRADVIFDHGVVTFYRCSHSYAGMVQKINGEFINLGNGGAK